MLSVPLHVHTTFSFGDGHGPVATHVERAAELGYKAMAFTEHGNTSSWVQAEQACKKHNIKPIYGCEIYFATPKMRAKTHMILLAMNEIGLQNINRIVSQSWRDHHYKPTVHWEYLKRFNEGIIVLSGCADSLLSCTLLGGKSLGPQRLEYSEADFQRAIGIIQKFKKVFGDRYYIEVQRFSSYDRTCALNPAYEKLANVTGTLLVATSDVHYPIAKRRKVQSLLYGARRGADISELETSWELGIPLTYPISDKEFYKDLRSTGLSKDGAKNAIYNTVAIAERCEWLELPKAPPLRFPLEAGYTDIAHFMTAKCLDGWRFRKFHKLENAERKRYKDRFDYEFKMISAKDGFLDYFAMVADIVQWAKSKGIAVGPGRGSAAASLICYMLQITEINPMEWPMLFERFIDADRKDLPDIDVDFEDERREEVFEYAINKYGREYSANILTFTRYKGKNTLDDIQRAYKIPHWKIDKIKDRIIERPDGHPRISDTIKDTINTFKDLLGIAKTTKGIELGPLLEGDYRNWSTHAAALVISPVPINNFCATYERDGKVGIAYDKHDAAYLGLLKMDLLSLSTMTMIRRAAGMIGKDMQFFYDMPMNDPKVLGAFKDGDVFAIFQYEGGTTRRICKDVAPTSFQQIADINALSRPGPLASGTTTDYVERRHSDVAEFEYTHDIVRQWTSWTYGLIVYQEQVLGIIRDLGNFPPTAVNRIRGIIQYKLGAGQFNELYNEFIKGCQKNGLDKSEGSLIWDRMVSSAGYSFNIAHSISYAKIAYWSQWLKQYHPGAFYTSGLISNGDAKEKLPRRTKLLQAAEISGLIIAPPDPVVSQSTWDYYMDTIVAGFTQIPGIGDKTADSIIEWRNAKPRESSGALLLEWSDLIEVPRIGEKTIEKIEAFANSKDPFNIGYTKRILGGLRDDFDSGRIMGVWSPTHTSLDIEGNNNPCVFMGISQTIKYYDALEQASKRDTTGRSSAEILRTLKSPDKLKYVRIYCEDEYGEKIWVGIDRWRYPDLEDAISDISLGRDVIVAKGKTSDFGGAGVQADAIAIIDPFG